MRGQGRLFVPVNNASKSVAVSECSMSSADLTSFSNNIKELIVQTFNCFLFEIIFYDDENARYEEGSLIIIIINNAYEATYIHDWTTRRCTH